jgi:hypothetical protein
MHNAMVGHSVVRVEVLSEARQITAAASYTAAYLNRPTLELASTRQFRMLR